LYAFSTENWTRPESEINALFSLLRRSLKSKRSHLFENRIRLRTIGDIGRLPPDLSADIEALGRETETFGHSLVLAINYGARDEIVRAFTRLERQGCSYPLTWETLSQALDTRGLPDPDLVVRTSGEQRLSNYLLLQAAYAELYFTPTAWPDFDVEELDLALKAYESRQRRFGDVGQET
jgi:undecaprenyl diphosphate synthase